MRSFTALLLIGLPLIGHAETAAELPVCVSIEVDGVRIPDYQCLSAAMAAPVTSGQPGVAPWSLDGTDPQRAPQQWGLFNQSALRTMLGNQFGKGVVPERPPR